MEDAEAWYKHLVQFEVGQIRQRSGATAGMGFFFDPGRGSGSGMQQWLRKQTS